MPEQLQPAIAIRLVLLRPHESEGRGRTAGSAHSHAEGIVEHRVGDGLASVRDPPRAAKRVPIIKPGGLKCTPAQSPPFRGGIGVADRNDPVLTFALDGAGVTPGAIILPGIACLVQNLENDIGADVR